MAPPLRILLVEDVEDDAVLLVRHLSRAGYAVSLERVETTAAMAQALDQEGWDIIISDYSLPEFSGNDALALVKQRGIDIPVIFLSGTIGEDIAVEAMKAGAQDYIMKGNLARLVPAVERELREARARREHSRAEEALRWSEARYRTLVETLPDVIYSVSAVDQTITGLNSAFERMTGWLRGEWLGRPFTGLVHPEDVSLVAERMHEALGGGATTPYELRLLTKKGDFLVAEITSTPKIEDGRIVEVSAIARDITDRKRMEEALRHQALHDALTGLPNRTLLRDRVHHATLAARRERRTLALLVMDLDQFKEVNDSLGHEAGDILLQEVGARLQGTVRASDTVARLGGDEFAVLLPAVHLAGATQVAMKLLAALGAPFILQGQSVEIGLSIGVALYPDHGEDAETLLRRADVAMYAAKRVGSGFRVYEPGQDQYSPGRLALRTDLRGAIERDELILHYQPKVHMASRRIAGVEALVRWQHPRHGLVPPGQFIPWAEEIGLIHPISRWVLEAAIRQAGAWHTAGLALPVAVNLSTADLHDDQLPQTIGELLDAVRLPPTDLVLEITESKLMADPVRALSILSRLDTMGVRIALDDFGTGYSSLGYLKRLPVSQIKIDKSFVIDMATDQNDAAIVLATISLSHALGLSAVAEGVEVPATWEVLASLGCDEAQGYFIARPMAAADFLRWLQESPWESETQAPRLAG